MRQRSTGRLCRWTFSSLHFLIIVLGSRNAFISSFSNGFCLKKGRDFFQTAADSRWQRNAVVSIPPEQETCPENIF